MIPPLRTLLVTLWVACIAGALVIAGLALGHYGWRTFVVAAAGGLILGLPTGLANWACLRPNRAREAGLRRD